VLRIRPVHLGDVEVLDSAWPPAMSGWA
jgi:hypothetical protein